MALIHKDEYLTHCLAGLGLQLFDECLEILHVPWTELVNQRTHEAWRRLAKLPHQIPPAGGAPDRLSYIGEDPFDLLVQFVAVGDDRYASVRVILQNPFGEQHHDDTFAAPLRVPDDAALVVAHMVLRFF